MYPAEVPSDYSLENCSEERLQGREDILRDLYSEFQGSVGAYAFFAVFMPSIIITSVFFGWGNSEDNALLSIAIAAAIFFVCMVISAYSWLWYFWSRKRLRQVEKLMRQKTRL